MVYGRAFWSGVFAVSFITCIPLSAWAGDWTQWGGTNNRNMVSTERGLPDFFEAERPKGGDERNSEMGRNVKWVVKLGAFVYGNPTVANGRVFVGTNAQVLSGDKRFKARKGGVVECLEENNGRLLWRLATPERHRLPAGAHFSQQHLGICSSVTVDGDRAYVVTSGGDILCLDVEGQANGNAGPFRNEGQYMAGEGKDAIELTEKDGDIIWRYDPIDELGVVPHDAASCSGLIIGDMLYVGTSNGVDTPHKRVIAPLAPSLIVLDKRTGKLVATDNEKLGTRLWHAQWASPSAGEMAGRTLLFFGGGDGVCYAFEALDRLPEEPVHLKKVWSYDCNPRGYRFRDGKPIPYYDGDKRKRTSPNRDDGKYVGPSQIIATPVFCKGRVYVAIGQDPAHGRGKGMFHCIDASKTGDITETGAVWTYDGLDRSIATAAVADGLVYVTDVAGKLHCLDADTGECCWAYETENETWGGALVADGRLYFGNKRDFYIMAAGRECKVLNKIKLSAPAYSTPVTANGVLYVASNRYLRAVSATP